MIVDEGSVEYMWVGVSNGDIRKYGESRRRRAQGVAQDKSFRTDPNRNPAMHRPPHRIRVNLYIYYTRRIYRSSTTLHVAVRRRVLTSN